MRTISRDARHEGSTETIATVLPRHPIRGRASGGSGTVRSTVLHGDQRAGWSVFRRPRGLPGTGDRRNRRTRVPYVEPSVRRRSSTPEPAGTSGVAGSALLRCTGLGRNATRGRRDHRGGPASSTFDRCSRPSAAADVSVQKRAPNAGFRRGESVVNAEVRDQRRPCWTAMTTRAITAIVRIAKSAK